MRKEFDPFADNFEFMEDPEGFGDLDLSAVQEHSDTVLCKDCAIDFLRQKCPQGGEA